MKSNIYNELRQREVDHNVSMANDVMFLLALFTIFGYVVFEMTRLFYC